MWSAGMYRPALAFLEQSHLLPGDDEVTAYKWSQVREPKLRFAVSARVSLLTNGGALSTPLLDLGRQDR